MAHLVVSWCPRTELNRRLLITKQLLYHLTTRAFMKLCKHCDTHLTSRQYNYCSTRCQKDYENSLNVTRWLDGNDLGYSGASMQLKPFVRRYMLELFDNSCSKCGWGELHPTDGKPLVEIDHIDGDASNCTPENLRVLCPNCHSMTPTFRARNKKSSRVR